MPDPFGASPTSSSMLRKRLITKVPIHVNWTRNGWKKEGVRIVYQASPFGLLSSAASRVSTILKPTVVSAPSQCSVGIISGNPSPSSISFLDRMCCKGKPAGEQAQRYGRGGGLPPGIRSRQRCDVVHRPLAAWPLHDIVITNIVWCVAYKR